MLGIRVEVTLVEPRSIARSAGKARRVTDRRDVRRGTGMKLQQLSLFIENKPGQLRAPCEALARAGIDILTMSLADTAQFGILRVVVADPPRAREVLQAAGMVVNVTEVVPVEVDDRAGGLAAALAAIEAAGLGIEYMYAFASGARDGRAVVVFRFEDPDRALALLEARGLRVVDAAELLHRKKP